MGGDTSFEGTRSAFKGPSFLPGLDDWSNAWLAVLLVQCRKTKRYYLGEGGEGDQER